MRTRWALFAVTSAVVAAGASTATVSVSGVGTATVVPDTASVQLGVTVTEDTLTAAQASASTQMQAIIDSLTAAGIEEKDIQTSSYYVSVVQNYDSNGNPSEVTSFQVQNQVNVVIRDISNVGDVLGITDSPNRPHRDMFPIDAQLVREGKASLPIAAGEHEMNVNITIRWAIDNHRVLPQ